MKQVFLIILLIYLLVLSFICIAVGVIHLIAPMEYRWLSQDLGILSFVSGLIVSLFVVFLIGLVDERY